LFGLDYFQREFLIGGTGWADFGTVSLVNQSDTAAGTLTKPAVDNALAATSQQIGSMKTQIYSAYVSDVVNILPNLSAMLSLRVDHFTGNPTAYAVEKSKATTTLSPKLGLVYQPIKDKVSIFANYMNGFQNVEPVENTDLNGTKYFAYFDPEHANQWEVGTKASLVKDKLSITASYYNLLVKDKVMPDPTNPLSSIQGGEVESKGFEISVVGSPIEGLNVIAGFSQNISEVTVGDPTYVGYRPEEAGPRNIFNFWANYKIQNGALKNVGVGFGANSASNLYTLNRAGIGTFTIPSYAVFNTALSYNEERYSIILKLDNIGNKKYFSGWSTVTPQRLRTLSLSLNYKF